MLKSCCIWLMFCLVTAYASQSNLIDGTYLIKNVETERYLFSTGDNITGYEGGWSTSPTCVGSDTYYYKRTYWKITNQGGDKYFIKNLETNRLLFSTGGIFTGNPGDEGGWLQSPKCVGSDANYYNRAYWRIIGQGGDKYSIVNVETNRYLFSTGEKISGSPGDEEVCTNAPKCVGSDANYYNRAYWKLLKQDV